MVGGWIDLNWLNCRIYYRFFILLMSQTVKKFTKQSFFFSNQFQCFVFSLSTLIINWTNFINFFFSLVVICQLTESYWKYCFLIFLGIKLLNFLYKLFGSWFDYNFFEGKFVHIYDRIYKCYVRRLEFSSDKTLSHDFSY